jgi:muramoyltetrapeptide carboxypeptidase LdcA involved in peptidoglycan recycling
MKKVKRLEKGDTIAVMSLSNGLPNLFPKVYEAGIRNLEKMGFKIKEYPTTRKSIGYLSSHPKERADDINNAFADKNVAGIITSIGGDDSIRILKYINPQIIKNNPKFFMGFSDTAVTNMYLNKLGIVTFNGPSIMAGIAQIENIEGYGESFETFLFESWKTYNYTPFKQYSDGYLDWRTTSEKFKEIKNSTGWNWGKGKAKGQLFGGCIEVLNFINGTEYWPKKSFFKNKILFIETSEEKPSPDYVKYTLRNFGIQGILENIGALLVGRARDYTIEEKKLLEENIKLVVEKEFGLNIPIITNMDFGHTDPQYIMPLGVNASVDCKKKEFKLLESPFL